MYIPIKKELEEGEYYWCSCGMSDTQPFCNGSHIKSDHVPLKFEIEKKKIVSLCTCKLTKNAPFCDGTHKQINEDLKNADLY